MKKQNGNVLMIFMIIMSIAISILMLVIAIFMGNINGIINGVKTDMYLINKSAILAVNKPNASIDKFSYNKKEYEKYFKQMIKKNYNLNDDLENKNGLIEKVTINEYEIIKDGKKDKATGKKVDGQKIHTVITVKIKPIILAKQLEKFFVFKIHEDVNLDMYKAKG